VTLDHTLGFLDIARREGLEAVGAADDLVQ
jgi:hypothetical protein